MTILIMNDIFYKLSRLCVLVLFFINSVFMPVDYAQAQSFTPSFNSLVPLSGPFSPSIVRGLAVYPDDPFKFDFIIDTGDNKLTGAAFKKESEKLIKYFLAALTVPENELWVNLSPYEKQRVVPEGLGATQMGIDMLAQDYLLKTITASMTYPESQLGKKFWGRVYEKSYQRFGTANIPVNTFNKVWIAPDKAVVYEKNNHVFIAERHLKVMLEEDYLALQKQLFLTPNGTNLTRFLYKNLSSPRKRGSNSELILLIDSRSNMRMSGLRTFRGNDTKNINNLNSQIVREIILPELEKEVNSGKNFAVLRQIYNSLILASWYKKKIKDSILAHAYANKNKVNGINNNDPREKEKIYQQYLNAFKKGIYNYIKEDADPLSGQMVPRKYFSGGLTVGVAAVKDLVDLTDAAQLSYQMRDFILHPQTSGQDLKVTWRAVENKVSDAAQSTILDVRESRPSLPINPVASFKAIEFPDIRIADRKEGLPLFIDISDDLKGLTYYEVLDDSKVFRPDGSVHYDVLSEANGTLKKIASFPSGYLVSPRKWMLDHFKGTPEGETIEKIWPLGKRYTRYRGVITSWDMDVDRDVWSTNIDTAFFHDRLLEDGALSLPKDEVKKITEVGVGGGHVSSLEAQTYPDAELSITDISSYALSDTLLNIIANNPQGLKALEHVRKYWGRGIEAIDDNQDQILINPPYIPAAPFEKGDANDPYRGTGLIREIIKDGYKKLNPRNPHASIYINISSLAGKDLQEYLKQFGSNIDFVPVGKPLKVPLKIRWISDEWKQWLLQNGGLERIENPAADQEEYWHTLQMYRLRRKAVDVQKPKRVAIIGGTFDPLHIAHRKMIEEVKNALRVDEVIVVPTNVSPHKLGKFSAPKNIRYQMAQAAVAGLDGVSVSDFDINREGPSYTIDLVNHFRSLYPKGSKFFFVIGDDNVEKLDTWRNIDELKEKVDFVTYTRPGKSKTNPHVSVQRIERPGIDISATIIRQRVALGFPLTGFVTLDVERIIKDNDLYLPEDVFSATDHDPIFSLNGLPFKDDKPFVFVADAHGTLLLSTWKKEYALAFQELTGKSFEEGLKWVEDTIVQRTIFTTRDVPFDEIVTMMQQELSLNNIIKNREEVIEVFKASRKAYTSPSKAEAMPGAIESIRELRQRGIPVKVVTGTRDSELVYQQLQNAGFGDLIAQEDVFARDRQEKIIPSQEAAGTPREMMIKHIMDGYPGHRLVLLDDWVQGADVAQHLDGIFVALPQGSGPEKELNSFHLRSKGAAFEIGNQRDWKRFLSLIKVLDARRQDRVRTMETKNVRVAMAQFNPTVGDLVGNFYQMVEKINEAKSKQTDIVVFPELAVTGYLPGDMLQNRKFVDQNKEIVRILAAQTKGITAVVGFVDVNRWGQIYNALAVLSDGEVKGIYRKRALPNYNVFFEKHYFTPGESGLFDFDGNELHKDIFNINGLMFGINDCEDIWVEKDGFKVGNGQTTVQEPVDHHVVAAYDEQVAKGARLIINASASPYREGVLEVRDNLLTKRARDLGAAIVYVNTVGGQDEVVFDGNSLAVSADGQIVARAKPFEEQMLIMDLPVKTEKRTPKELDSTITVQKNISDAKEKLPDIPKLEELSPIELKFKALILSLRDYLRKNGFKKVIFGNSGGIDSAVVGALAEIALGPENVHSISMPTRFNTDDTKSDAQELAHRLGIGFEEISIEPVFNAIVDTLMPHLSQRESKAARTAIENIQARLRMIYLMVRSNADGYLLVSTSNKSESAVGYTTLGGDMSGGFALIKDLYKTDVFEMARFINKYYGREVIPESIITRPPSAQLSEGQTDAQSLPDYGTQLDPILKESIEHHFYDELIAEHTGLPLEMVIRVRKMIDGADHKRRQAPIGTKLTKVAFGHFERRMPITKRYDPQATDEFIKKYKAQAERDHAMASDLVPLHRVFGEKRIVELPSDKGVIRMELSEFNDKEIRTLLLNPEIVKDARVTLVHSIDTDDDVLQAILILGHLRQYNVGQIDLIVKGQKFMGLEPDEDTGESHLMTALSLFADKISFMDQKNGVHEVKNIKPFTEITKQELPFKVDRLLYLNHQFKASAEQAVKILSNHARADNVTVQNRYGLRFVELPEGLQNQNVVIYHSTESSQQIMDLVLTLIALRQQGVHSISLVDSYLGYARQDKIARDGEAINGATVLGMINRMVDHHFVINAHYGKATGFVELKSIDGTSIYNLNGFVPMAEFMLNQVISKITAVVKPEELPWDAAKKLAPMIKKEFRAHPVIIVGPDKGSKIYSQEAAHELKRLIKAAYGVDIPVYVGYLPKKRDTTTGVITRNDSPTILDIDTDKPLALLGGKPLKDAWAFVLDDMTDTGGTILSATYILVKKLGLQWRHVFTGIVHGVLSQKLLPFRTGLTPEQISNATPETLPAPEYINDIDGRMPPYMLASMRTLLLPKETATFKQVPPDNLIAYIIHRIIGENVPARHLLEDVVSDPNTPFWKYSPQKYVDYLNRFRVNHKYPERNLKNPPEYTDPRILKADYAHPDLDNPSLSPDERKALEEFVKADVKRWAPDTDFRNGRPINNLRTGLRGRAKLGKYGPSLAEDPVHFRFNLKGQLEVLLIERGDGTGGGFPGGFSNSGQENLVGFTATREGIEEVLKKSDYAVDFREGTVVYNGKAYSSRDTDGAWIVTRALAVLVSYEYSKLLNIEAADDAKKGSARWEPVTRELLTKLVDAHPEILKEAVKAILSGEIRVRDDLVKPKDQLLEEVSHPISSDSAMTGEITTPNTITEEFKIPLDSSNLDKPLTEERRHELIQQVIQLNPGFDPEKLFHMMNWDVRQYDQEHLPSIVGIVKNQQEFSMPKGMRILDMAIRMPGQGWAIPKELEQFQEVIQMAEEHERLINPDFDKKYYVYITVDQKIVEPRESQRRPGWHGDAFVSSETSELFDAKGNPKEVTTDNTYVIADSIPTLFLPGPFSLRGTDAENIPAVLKRFDETARGQVPLRYEPYELLRMTPYDLHAPDFNISDRRISRTFVKIQFSRDRLNRGGNAINPLLDYDGWSWVARGAERNNRNVLIGWKRPDKDKFELIDPTEIDFDKDTVDVPWAKKEFFWGIKTQGVRREPVKPGEELMTVVNGFESTFNIAKEGDWKITTSLGDQYFLSDQRFKERYQTTPDANGIHAPISRPVKMLEITKPIRFLAPWGAIEYAPAGSVLVKLSASDIYVVLRDNFYVSYQQTDPQGVKRTPSTITTNEQLEEIIRNETRLSKYTIKSPEGGKDLTLDFQLPLKVNLDEPLKQVTFVLDMDETLASRGLTDDVTTENLDQIIRGLRMMRERPELKIRFIINSANTYKRYILSRFGKKLSELEQDRFVQKMDHYQAMLENIREDLKARSIDPNDARIVISRRKSIEERLLLPLLSRAKEEDLESQLANVEIRAATGQEIIKYDPKEHHFYLHPSQLMYTEQEQLAVSKVLLNGYLEKLDQKLGRDFSKAIGLINESKTFFNTEVSRGVINIFEEAIQGLGVRILPFNGEISLIFYDEQSKVDGKVLAREITKQLKQQELIKPHRPYFIEGDDQKGVRISLFDKSFETKGMIRPDEYVVAMGDSPIDTFLTEAPNDRTLPIYLGTREEMKDHPSVIVALDKDGHDHLKERGAAMWMSNIFDVMQEGGTWADVKIVNGLLSTNELRKQLSDKAMHVPGGIDFNPAMANLQIKNEGQGIASSLYSPSVTMVNFSGVTPVIIKIQQFKDIYDFLGLNQDGNDKFAQKTLGHA